MLLFSPSVLVVVPNSLEGDFLKVYHGRRRYPGYAHQSRNHDWRAFTRYRSGGIAAPECTMQVTAGGESRVLTLGLLYSFASQQPAADVGLPLIFLGYSNPEQYVIDSYGYVVDSVDAFRALTGILPSPRQEDPDAQARLERLLSAQGGPVGRARRRHREEEAEGELDRLRGLVETTRVALRQAEPVTAQHIRQTDIAARERPAQRRRRIAAEREEEEEEALGDNVFHNPRRLEQLFSNALAGQFSPGAVTIFDTPSSGVWYDVTPEPAPAAPRQQQQQQQQESFSARQQRILANLRLTTAAAGGDHAEEDEECPVCRNAYATADNSAEEGRCFKVRPTSCAHAICLDCALIVREGDNKCPMCRVPISSIRSKTCYECVMRNASDTPANTRLSPCEHTPYCAGCCEEVILRGDMHCPLCRFQFTNAERV